MSYPLKSQAQTLSAEDLQIFTIVLDSLARGQHVFLFDSTFTSDRFDEKAAQQMANPYEGYSLGHWYRRNFERIPIPVNLLQSKRKLTPVSNAEKGIRLKGELYKTWEMSERFEGIFPIEISAPGYNDQQTEAFVEMSQLCWIRICGVIWNVVLEQNDGWRIKRVTANWDI